LDLDELRNLDLRRIGTASLPIRVGAVVIICGAILAAGYYFDIRHQLDVLEQVEAKEDSLRERFEQKQKKAAHLEEYKRQLAEMRRSLGAMLRQLPSKTEIPGLIVDISQTGLSAGLEIELFKPRSEVEKGFYAEKPIDLRMVGTYHELADFVSGVAALPRIVTLEQIALKPRKGGEDLLTMEATAKTYRYLERGEG